MISHDRAQELISARMDAALTSAEHHELHAHLATCESCRVFVASADDLARGLQVLPRLASSPAVSRAVMAAVATESSGWGWLRQSLQTLSSPGMAVASGLALVVALAGAMVIAMNAPGSGDDNSADPEGTIAAVAVQPLPTEVPTEAPEPEPTATQTAARTIVDPTTKPPARTPTPEPTETRAPVAMVAETTVPPTIAPAAVESPPIAPVTDEAPDLAMASEAELVTEASTDLAQTAAEPVQTGEEATQAETAPDTATESAPEDAGADNARRGDGGDRKDNNGEATTEEVAPVSEPVATETMPVPDEAIAAIESAGESSDVILPPAPALPMPPSQAFLPITPTPESDGTPTPERETQADAPQLAEESSGDLGVTALAPEAPDVAISEPDVTVVENEDITAKEKRDKSSKDGKSHENQQRAHGDGAMGWSMAPLDLAQTAVQPQITDEAVATVTPAETAGTAPTTDPAPQIDPTTGYQIEPTTGLLIDPATGYLLDLVNGLVYHPGTGYQVHPFTGLLIDPATGAQLDPVTLAIVIPAGFGSDQPAYVPGDDAMRGQIEANVDETYDNATYKVIPATDGPVQPVDEIVVPVESGEAVEIQ